MYDWTIDLVFFSFWYR